MMDLKNYDCFVGTSRGVIICKYNIKLSIWSEIIVIVSDDIEKQSGIKFQKEQEASEITILSFRNEDEILLGYSNGSVSVFNSAQNKYVNKLRGLEGEGRIVGLNSLGKKIIAAKRDGIINLWTAKKTTYFDINLEEKGSLEAMVVHPLRSNVIGTGGEHNDFKLWDIETQQCIFKAKSVRILFVIYMKNSYF